MSDPLTNWAGQYGCTPRRHVHPTSTEDVQRFVGEVRQQGRKLRVFGTGHSPSDIAMCDDVVMSLSRMDRVLSIDTQARSVTVQAGASLERIDSALRGVGLALPSLGSIAVQTLAGAVATATHGTGLRFGTLSSLVEGVKLVDGTGAVVRIARDENADWLDAARCHLGALGVITELSLAVSDAFDLNVVERPGTLDDVLLNLEERLQADHYRFWYLPHAEKVWEWAATRAAPESAARPSALTRAASWARDRIVGYHAFELALYAATFDDRLVPPINRAYARALFGRPRASGGPSREMFNFDCLFKQHVDEWAIPIERTAEALRGLRELIRAQGLRVHLPIEVRFARGDTAWLSPTNGRDSCYVGVISYLPFGRAFEHADYFAAFESLMLRLEGRPHWAKRFGPDAAALRPRYPHWDDFAALRAKLDPDGLFTNTYTRRVLGDIRTAARPAVSA